MDKAAYEAQEAKRYMQQVEDRLRDTVMTARIRAVCNKSLGGIVLTCDCFKEDGEGGHVRVLVDGGNMCDGEPGWVLSYAYGGNYDMECSAMASAVAAVIGAKVGSCDKDRIDESNWSVYNWPEVAKKHGWRLFMWETAKTVVLIPYAKKCRSIKNRWNTYCKRKDGVYE